MPRFTVLQPGPTAPFGINEIAQAIRDGLYTHRVDVDFETEESVKEAIKAWGVNERRPTVIIQYEPVLENQQYRLLGITATFPASQPYIFDPPLLVQINDNRQLITQRQARQWVGQNRNQTQVINDGQSTHKHSVHKTVTESINRLYQRYNESINIQENIEKIKKFKDQITAKKFPKTTDLERKAAINFIKRMEFIFDNKENGSQQTIETILALVWQGMTDPNQPPRKVNPEIAQEKFIKHLYEAQRGYNIDKDGNDDMKEDKPICIGGIINKLVDTLNGGLHEDVVIAYITKGTAGLKFDSLVREHAVKYVRESNDKIACLTSIEEGKVGTGPETRWGIPEDVLEAIKEDVRKKFYEEFTGKLPKADLDVIFKQCDYISLRKSDLDQLAPTHKSFDLLVNKVRKLIEDTSEYKKGKLSSLLVNLEKFQRNQEFDFDQFKTLQATCQDLLKNKEFTKKTISFFGLLTSRSQKVVTDIAQFLERDKGLLVVEKLAYQNPNQESTINELKEATSLNDYKKASKFLSKSELVNSKTKTFAQEHFLNYSNVQVDKLKNTAYSIFDATSKQDSFDIYQLKNVMENMNQDQECGFLFKIDRFGNLLFMKDNENLTTGAGRVALKKTAAGVKLVGIENRTASYKDELMGAYKKLIEEVFSKVSVSMSDNVSILDKRPTEEWLKIRVTLR